MLDEPIALPSEPFGDPDVDTEMKRLRGRYSDVYLEDTEFSARALDPNVYLISGRRGTGKTALSRYFTFQKQMPGIVHIEVRDRDAYPQILASIATLLAKSPATAIPELVQVWEFAIWTVIFDRLSGELKISPTLPAESDPDETPSDLLTRVFNWACRQIREKDDKQHELKLVLGLHNLEASIASVKNHARRTQQRIILSIDTVEKYDIDDKPLMMAVAALVQFASDFTLAHSPDVQIKVFLPGEIYTILEEAVLLAPSKHMRQPLHLIWTPNDLLRLIMWRFWKHLFLSRASVRMKPPNVRWSDAADVYKKMWREHLGVKIAGPGRNETSFSFVLRHTQMRPRQLIYACNAIAAQAPDDQYNYAETHVTAGVAQVQGRLVADVINSFILTYPQVNKILDATAGIPPVLTEKDLVRYADGTATYWREGLYSPDRYRDLLSELGVIGRIIRKRGRSPEIIEAEFDYSTSDRVVIGRNEDCVIHPMFHRRLNIRLENAPRVLPFGPHLQQLEEIIA